MEKTMDWLEEELRRSLAKEEPPAGFDDRVRRRLVRRFPRWPAAIAAAVLLTGGAEIYQWHRGRVARERVLLAMRITGGKLRQVQAHFRGGLR
jgi:hypothetical protein